MAIYEIINVGANKALNIYGSDVKGNTLYDGRSIILWTSSGSGEQCWIVPSLRSAPYIRSYLNRDFGIHANKNGTSKYACDIHTITGSADTKIALTEVSNGYKIKLEGENMYLTANGTGNGASVSWALRVRAICKSGNSTGRMSSAMVGPQPFMGMWEL